MKRTLAAAAAACGANLQGADAAYANVSSDTRTLARGDLFVALKGPNFDAHDFLEVAASKGAAGAIVSQGASAGKAPDSTTLPRIVAGDSLAGLTALANAWRSQFSIPVVGVGGSNGKTTVKEMTAAILSRLGPCLSTRGNLNNHIGVPLTLMRLDATHRSAVIEIGANRLGEVAQLAQIARPTIGLITNAGAEHLEGFGDLDGVARGEGEMVAALPADGLAVINADDAYFPLWRQMSTARRIVSFGLATGADFRAADITQSIVDGEFRLQFTLHSQNSQRRAQLRLAGRHNVVNALAAAAAAHAAGADIDAIVEGLDAVRAVSGRLQLKRAQSGAWIIDDSYNANLSSVEAALRVLGDLPGPKWMVLGDMAELGEASEQTHKDAGELARRHGVTRLFASGPLTVHAVRAFGAGADWFSSVEELTKQVSTELGADTTLLIKGSRVNRLERVVAALTNKAN